MPSWVRAFSVWLIFSLMGWPFSASAQDFNARIKQAELEKVGENYYVQTRIEYQLSPTAKEALQKGVPLNWTTEIEIRRIGRIWDSTVSEQALTYGLRFHALLNQYEVVTPDGENEMFLTLNAAMNFLSGLQQSRPIASNLLLPDQRYQLAVICRFERELLPVPLRPLAYIKPDWFLSSDWYLCLIQK